MKSSAFARRRRNDWCSSLRFLKKGERIKLGDEKGVNDKIRETIMGYEITTGYGVAGSSQKRKKMVVS